MFSARRFLFVLTIAVSLSTGSPAANAVSDESKLTITEILSVARSTKAFKPKDDFDTRPALPRLTGKQFQIDLPVIRMPESDTSSICPGVVEWGYDPQTSILTVYYGFAERLSPYVADYGDVEILGGPRSFSTFKLYSLECNTFSGGTYPASNAFGVRVHVRVQKFEFIALAATSNGSILDFDKWEKTIQPDDARALVTRLRLRVSGTVSEWAGRGQVFCGNMVGTPTISFPVERRRSGCFVAVDVTSVEIVDSATGLQIPN